MRPTYSAASLLVVLLFFSTGAITASAAPVAGPPYSWQANPPIHVRYLASTSPSGLLPSQVYNAYGFNSLSCAMTGYPWGDSRLCGYGQTVAIVDAYDDPNAAADLSTFSSQFGLPACTSANGCFVKAMPGGSPRGDQGWALEISLDVQWAHAVAPGARIMLVESSSNTFSSLLSAISYASQQAGVHQVSMSWGGSEFSSESSYDSYFQVSGVSYFASSGDGGTGVIWPSSSPYVVGVGGTTLSVDSSGRVLSETAWSGSGGGMSAYISEPSYQSTYGISSNGMRGIPDVSYDADPNTGFPVYDSYGYNSQYGWFQVGGTSAGSPQWAALMAIINGQASSPLSSISFGTMKSLYAAATGSTYSADFRDISSGTNGNCGSVCTAVQGYDFVTGVGSPLAASLVSFLASRTSPSPDFGISVSPSALSVQQGGSGGSTVTVTSLNGFSSSVGLTVSGTPSGVTVSLTPSSVTPPSGGAATSSLSILVGSSVTPGTYTLTVTGTTGPLSHSTQVSLTVTTPGGSALSVGVRTDKATYSTKSFAYITVTATANGAPVAGASVSVTVTGPTGATSSFSGTTGSNGQVTFKYRINPNVPTGTYTVAALASAAGYASGTGTTSFSIA